MPSPSATSKSGELRTRILSALVLAPVALGLAWIGGWPFAAMLAAASVAMALELGALLPGGNRVRRGLLVAIALATVLSTAFGLPLVALLIGAAGLAFALANRLLKGDPVWPALFAFPYLVLPLASMIWLRLDPEFGRTALFWLLGVVWATDTFAYFAGRGIGGLKLAPRLSPNKTWAGLIGGMVGAALVGAAVSIVLTLGSPLRLALVSAFLAVVAQAGDITESALKRRAGVKDSGKLIPGHGGILDRVDGLVTAAVGAALLSLIHGAATPGAGVLIWP
ncbi:MAG: phosphatidate cytidylyltransferase [Parvibaculum sp.]|uniref:phosphatidate cytidylyltransferase n=1 Tax=Parvibaculum sp. TaxID=2024848 RepID=UPI0028431259|nr:phosphatidate cytidylyltransferase [Parvibaculum sp.]MDR3500103.1 phosphatidate cytidylyltransferase [Parvibaculum sp.]